MTFIILASILMAAALLFFLFLRFIFTAAFAPLRNVANNPRRIPKSEQYAVIKQEMFCLVDELEAAECEKVCTTSSDGLRLCARYFDRGRNDIIEIDFHGYRGHALRDFCGGSSIAKLDGRSSLLIDERSHGDSEGSAITFGIKERFDVISWVEYVIGRFGDNVKIILSGVSMGAATVLMASELNLPKNVIGIIADCPYTSPKEIICKVAWDRGLNPKFFYPFIRLSARLFAKTKLEQASPIEAVKNTDIPILIIHGDDDRFVPYHMGKELYEACASKNKHFLTVGGAGHAISFFKDRELYIKTVREFIESIL